MIDGDWLELRRFGSYLTFDPKGLEPNYISNNTTNNHTTNTSSIYSCQQTRLQLYQPTLNKPTL